MSTKEDSRIRKRYLIASLLINLGILGFFKYANFITHSFQSLTSFFGLNVSVPVLDIILPIGISFYTFQTLSYTIDVYRKKLEPASSLRDFALFVSFFPQLVAGPIVRAADFLPQLKNKIIILPENIKAGLTLVAWGLVKKMVFADNIAIFANGLFTDPAQYPGSLPIWLGALAFGIQIYCDFSGYSDIAIGLARIFGFTLQLNFDKPYFAKNITEFWKRWHISLSSWLRDYLYIPLGGNRKGKARTYINLMVTMILGGLWHGASWNFVLWGFYQGSLLSIHRLFEKSGITRIIDLFGRAKKYISVILTQYFVFLGWLLFRLYDSSGIGYAVVKYLSFDFTGAGSIFSELISKYELSFIFLFLFILIHIYLFFNKKFLEKIAEKENFYWGLYIFVVCLSLYFFSAPEGAQFIYFRF